MRRLSGTIKQQNRLLQLRSMLKVRKDPKTGEYRPGTEQEVKVIQEEIDELIPLVEPR